MNGTLKPNAKYPSKDKLDEWRKPYITPDLHTTLHHKQQFEADANIFAYDKMKELGFDDDKELLEFIKLANQPLTPKESFEYEAIIKHLTGKIVQSSPSDERSQY